MHEFQSGFWWNLLVTGSFHGTIITLRMRFFSHLSFFRESAPFTAFGGASPVGGRKIADGLWQIDEKSFDFKHQSSHPPLRGCPSQGRMKFLRPQAGYEGRVGGDIKNAALTNLRRTFTITTIFTIITMHSLIFSCTGMHEFQPGF